MNLIYTPVSSSGIAARSAYGAADRYVQVLGWALLGYALLSRGFAYWGVPPIFVGEIILLVGLFYAATSGSLLKVALTPTGIVLVLLLALAASSITRNYGMHGVDAIRDGMQLGYGLFAFIIATLLIARPERLKNLIASYRKYTVAFLASIWAVYLAFRAFESSVPFLPWSDSAHIFEAKGGDIMVQLAGIATFLMVGLIRRRPLLLFALAANAAIVMVSNRGGMIAFFLAILVGYVLRPPEARVGKLAYAFLFFVLIGLIVGPIIPVNGASRDISVEQLWLNIKSVLGRTESDSLEGTKKWRMDWWETIFDYTVRGEYFWTGKGFGVNLAKDDGFLVDPSLRSPHNGHMTILARLGVPGAILWILLQLIWFATLIRAWLRARERKESRWMALFAVLVSYWVAMHLNATFDVYFEGPMGGIWFWTVFGVGIGAVYIHRHHPDVLFDSDDPNSTRESLGYGASAPTTETFTIWPPRRRNWGWPAPSHPPST